MAIQLVNAAPAVGRKWRNPRHSFQLVTIPYQIQPFLIAPVLPGETLKNALLQVRAVSDAVKAPLLGWWKEYYLFYVRLTDLADAEKFKTMLLTPGYDVTANGLNNAAASATLYRYAGSMDYVSDCLDAVTKSYFRDEGEVGAPSRGGLPLASAFGKGSDWLDSLTLGANVPEIDPDDTSGIGNEQQLLTWEFMRAQKMTNLSYEDFLKTFGVNNAVKDQEPELIRYVKEWTYPANTVDATGAVNSQLSWSIQERADKDRLFKEHGFIFGVTVTRPKVYRKNQTGAAVGLLNDAFSWLPAVLRENMEASLKNLAELSGPISVIDDATNKGYWIDVKDLFLYGDDFKNFALTATDAGLVALPTANASRKYVADADVDALFKTATSNKIREDGVVQLAVLGAQQETT